MASRTPRANCIPKVPFGMAHSRPHATKGVSRRICITNLMKVTWTGSSVRPSNLANTSRTGTNSIAKQSCNMPVVMRSSALFFDVNDMMLAFAAINLKVNQNQQMAAPLVWLVRGRLPTLYRPWLSPWSASTIWNALIITNVLLTRFSGNGIRITDQSQIVVGVIENSEDRPDFDQLYRRAVKKDVIISIGTLYRTVKLRKGSVLLTVLDLVMVVLAMKSMLSFVNIWLMLKQAKSSKFTILNLNHWKSSLCVT